MNISWCVTESRNCGPKEYELNLAKKNENKTKQYNYNCYYCCHLWLFIIVRFFRVLDMFCHIDDCYDSSHAQITSPSFLADRQKYKTIHLFQLEL